MVPLFRLVGKPSLSLAYSLAWSRLSPRASSSCVIMPRHSPKRSRQSSTTVGLHEQATAYRKPTTRLPLCALAPVYFLVCSEADMSQKRSERTMLPSNASVMALFPLVTCTQTNMFPPTERWRTNNRKEGSHGNPPLLGILLVLFLEPGEPRRVSGPEGASSGSGQRGLDLFSPALLSLRRQGAYPAVTCAVALTGD